MSLINCVMDRLDGGDIIDLYFILSDLKDMNISEREAAETSYLDAQARFTEKQNTGTSPGTPIGKQVW